MITLKSVFHTILLLLTTLTLQASANISLIIPDKIRPNDKSPIMLLAKQLSDTLNQGDSFFLYTASKQHLKLVNQVQIPLSENYSSSKIRKKWIERKLLPGVFKHVMTHGNSEHNPLFLPSVARRLSTLSTHNKVVLYGSPSAASFDFTKGYPSPSHISAELQLSEYGVHNAGYIPSALNVYWVLPEDTQFISNQHQYRLEQFFATFLHHATTAKLCMFTIDPSLLSHDCLPPTLSDISNDKLEFNLVSPIPISENREESWLTTSVLENKPLPNTLVQNLEIGITWKEQLDLDLHIKHSAFNEEVVYSKPDQPFAYLIKDITTAPDASMGYETVFFKKPTNLSDLRIFVNLYKVTVADGEDIKFQVRLRADNAVYSQEYSLPKTMGNAGKAPRDLPYWIEIDTEQLVKRH